MPLRNFYKRTTPDHIQHNQRSDAEPMNTIYTSQEDWATQALKSIHAQKSWQLVDDAQLGISTEDCRSGLNLLKYLSSQSSYRWTTLAKLLSSLGLSSAGIWMVAAAIADPEPTSKLGLLVAGGITIALTGGLGVLSTLGMPLSIEAHGPAGSAFKIAPKAQNHSNALDQTNI